MPYKQTSNPDLHSFHLTPKEYRDILINAPIGIFISTPEGRLLDTNPAMARMFGYESPQELIDVTEDIGRQFYADPEDRNAIIRHLEKHGEILAYVCRCRHKDGSLFWGSNSFRVVEDATGKSANYRGFFSDVTRHKEAEEALKESEKKYRFLTSEMTDILWTLDLNFRTTYVSPSIETVLGFTPEERKHQDPANIMTPESLTRIMETLARELAKERTEDVDPDRSLTVEVAYYHKEGHIVWTENVVRGIRDHDGTLIGIHGVSRDISKRKEIEKKLEESLVRLQKALSATVRVVSATIGFRDPYTVGHERRVAGLARSIALEMKLPKDTIEGIGIAATIHDLGKISVPAEILSKPTRLTDIELAIVKTHPQCGYNILKDIEFPWPVARIIHEHHERIDGSGYPCGLTGDEMLIESRILAVADVVEGMASHRPYRPALGIDAALEEITKHRGIFYDPAVVDACLLLFKEKGYKMKE